MNSQPRTINFHRFTTAQSPPGKIATDTSTHPHPILNAKQRRTAPALLAVAELARPGLPLKAQAAASAKEVEQKRRHLQAAESNSAKNSGVG